MARYATVPLALRPKLTHAHAIIASMTSMTRFYCLKEINEPEDIIPFLGKPDLHWKPGYSACELARSWVRANGIPPTVAAVLETSPDYASAELLEGFFERKVRLRSRGAPTQTDLMALVKTPQGRRIVAVEGKVDEPFGPLVAMWNNGSPGKTCRLAELSGVLGLAAAAVGGLRYQLMHRAVSAIYEASRYGADKALLLVHSFSASSTSFDDFKDFAAALDCQVSVGAVSRTARICEGVELRFAWVADKPSSG